jgi:hypothetical protein
LTVNLQLAVLAGLAIALSTSPVGAQIEQPGSRTETLTLLFWWPDSSVPAARAGNREAAEVRANGVSSQNLVASEAIWEFFAAHARR